MAISKIFKSLKITDIDTVNDKTWRYIDCANEYPEIPANEARELAQKMTGQYDWHGIKGEMISYTGLARLANKYLATTATTFRIKEATVHGDGTSRYILK